MYIFFLKTFRSQSDISSIENFSINLFQAFRQSIRPDDGRSTSRNVASLTIFLDDTKKPITLWNSTEKQKIFFCKLKITLTVCALKRQLAMSLSLHSRPNKDTLKIEITMFAKKQGQKIEALHSLTLYARWLVSSEE